MARQRKPVKQRRLKWWYSIPAVLVMSALVITILELANVTHLFHQQKNGEQPTASQNTKGEVGETDTSNAPETSAEGNDSTQSAGSSQPGDTKSNSTAGNTTSATLLAPTGDFVSTHHIPLSASMTSVCNTTPGASCTITFTSASTTKSLPTQTTDRGGSTYWDETPKSIGLTPGTWKITATATLGGQTQSSSDVTNLEVTE